jgi:hypothetical protein
MGVMKRKFKPYDGIPFRSALHPYDAALLPHASPLGWEHIILSGDFDWHSGAAERKIARPLHIRPARDWGT